MRKRLKEPKIEFTTTGYVYIHFPDKSRIKIRWPDGHTPCIDDFDFSTFRADDPRGWRSKEEIK